MLECRVQRRTKVSEQRGSALSGSAEQATLTERRVNAAFALEDLKRLLRLPVSFLSRLRTLIISFKKVHLRQLALPVPVASTAPSLRFTAGLCSGRATIRMDASLACRLLLVQPTAPASRGA